jgi:hypothetical protein
MCVDSPGRTQYSSKRRREEFASVIRQVWIAVLETLWVALDVHMGDWPIALFNRLFDGKEVLSSWSAMSGNTISINPLQIHTPDSSSHTAMKDDISPKPATHYHKSCAQLHATRCLQPVDTPINPANGHKHCQYIPVILAQETLDTIQLETERSRDSLRDSVFRASMCEEWYVPSENYTHR